MVWTQVSTLQADDEYDAEMAYLLQEIRESGCVQMLGASPLAPEAYRPPPQVDPAKRWSCRPSEREVVPARFLSRIDRLAKEYKESDERRYNPIAHLSQSRYSCARA